MADRNLILQLLITAKDQASAALQGVRTSIGAIGDAASRVLEPLRTFGGLLASAAGIGGSKELADRADAYTRLSNSLKIATANEAEYKAALETVAEIASRTNADLETTGQLYGKVAQSSKELGLSQQQVGQLAESIAKGMQLSGASAETASGAILQLTQAFGSGALRGEEFNSVMEASPELLRFLATGLGVTIGELRGLAEQGALTSRAVTAALLSQKDAIDKAYGETTRTVADAFTVLNNQLILYVGKLNESSGATAAIGATMRLLADNLNVVAAAAGAGLVTALGKGAVAFGAYVKESLAAAQASRDVAIATKAQQAAALQTAQGNVAAAQAAVNRAVAEQRMAAILVQEASGETAVARARAAAAAAAQTATVATTRYMAAQEALNVAQAATTTSAGLLSRAMGFLAGPGGLILLAVSAFGALLPMLSKSKTDLDALAVSTDQYQESVNKLNTAQLKAELLRINQAINEQAVVVARAKSATEEWDTAITDTGEVMRIGHRSAEELTLAQGKLADEQAKLAALTDRLKIAQDALNASSAQGNQETAKQLATYGATKVAMQTYAADLEKLGKQQDAVNKANQERVQSELDLAKASGDVQAVERLTLALAKERAVAAQQQAELDRAAAAAAKIKLKAVQGEYDLIRDKLPKDEENLRLARQDVELKNAQAAASGAAAKYLKALAEEARNLGIEQAKVLDTEEQLLLAQRNEAEQSALLARAKGNEYEARQQLVRVAEIEASLAALNAKKKAIELRAATESLKIVQDEIQGKQELGEAISAIDSARLKSAANAMNAAAIEAEAAGLVAEAEARKAAAIKLGSLNTGEAIDKTRQNAEALQAQAGFVEQDSLAKEKNAEATQAAAKEGGSMAGVLAGLVNYWRQATGELSAATQALFEWNAGLSKIDPQYGRNTFGSISDEADKASSEIDRLTGFVTKLRQEFQFSSNDIGQWMDQIQIAGASAQKAYYEQKLEAERLISRLGEVGESGAQGFAAIETGLEFVNTASRQTRDSLWLLNQQDMDRLESALEGATQKLQDMQEATDDARQRLAELNAELLEAQGEDQKAEILRQQLDYQEQLAEIEKQRQQAAAIGNRDLVAILDDQRQVLEQINAAKLASIQNTKADSDAAEKSITAANGIQGAWSGAADEIERAGRAVAMVGDADLSRLSSQLTSLGVSARGLADVL